MKKLIITLALSPLFVTVGAQPKCLFFGPAFNAGSVSVSNYSFTRTYATDASGAPQTTFSGLSSYESKARSWGMMMDINTKHSRIGLDLMFPVKNAATNMFNFNLAFGGYIKERFGILLGGSYYVNPREFDGPNVDGNHVKWDLVHNHEVQGDFYNTNFLAQGLGVNALFNIALSESIILSFDYGFYNTDIATKKVLELDNYDWNSDYSRKLEIRLCMQVPDEPFGFAIKYMNWKTTGNYVGNIEYMENGTTSQTAEINLMPERTYILKNLVFSLMIPLGTVSSTTTTITVIE